MKPVKMCYKIKYCLKKCGIELRDSCFEILITWYYRIFKRRKQGISPGNKRRRKVIVSMTSIPARIDKVWITVESLLRQTYKPDEIIVWLALDEFEGMKLPERLQEQQKRGLQIHYCDNLRSYKKFYDTALRYPHVYIVTVDDDIIYAEDMMEALVRAYRKNPGCIICNRARYMKKSHAALKAYESWINHEERMCMGTEASFHNFFIGCGGTLIPMFRMNRKVLDREAFMELAPYADDVWLNFCAWISGIKTVCTKGIWGHVMTIESSSDMGLSRANVTYQRNDEQIEKVVQHLKIEINQYLY